MAIGPNPPKRLPFSVISQSAATPVGEHRSGRHRVAAWGALGQTCQPWPFRPRASMPVTAVALRPFRAKRIETRSGRCRSAIRVTGTPGDGSPLAAWRYIERPWASSGPTPCGLPQSKLPLPTACAARLPRPLPADPTPAKITRERSNRPKLRGPEFPIVSSRTPKEALNKEERIVRKNGFHRCFTDERFARMADRSGAGGKRRFHWLSDISPWARFYENVGGRGASWRWGLSWAESVWRR